MQHDHFSAVQNLYGCDNSYEIEVVRIAKRIYSGNTIEIDSGNKMFGKRKKLLELNIKEKYKTNKTGKYSKNSSF